VTVPAAKLVGFRGRDARAKAMERSRYASPTPSVRTLADGSLVGVGETIVDDRGRQDVMLYGARGTSAWASDVDRRPSEGRPESERERVVMSARVLRQAVEAIDARAAADGVSRSALIERWALAAK